MFKKVVTVNNGNSVTNSTNSNSIFNGNIDDNGTTDNSSNNGNIADTVESGITIIIVASE